MNPETHPTSFICTLPGKSAAIAYHVVVDFIDAQQPECVRFTSFVGDGRRSFRVVASARELAGAFGTAEALCRLAIGQVLRDNLCDKSVEGDRQLDPAADPWQGELKPVGSRGGGRPPLPRMQG